MQHDLADQHIKTYKERKKWLDEWIASNNEHFFIADFIFCQKNGKKLAKDGKYFE